jgi:hypothetical protein
MVALSPAKNDGGRQRSRNDRQAASGGRHSSRGKTISPQETLQSPPECSEIHHVSFQDEYSASSPQPGDMSNLDSAYELGKKRQTCERLGDRSHRVILCLDNSRTWPPLTSAPPRACKLNDAVCSKVEDGPGVICGRQVKSKGRAE